jgi:transposase
MADSNTFQILIGLDWGDRQHAFALRQAGGPMHTGTVAAAPEKLHRWLDELQRRFPDRQIAIALETTRGPLIHALLSRAWITIFAIHPATTARYRQAFTPSGAKDDTPDALLLLDLLDRHRDKLQPLCPDDVQTRTLGGLVEARRKTVNRRTGLLNALKALLKDYYPQALQLVGNHLASPLALDWLERWPDLQSLQLARPATLRRFYYTHNVRRPECVQERLEFIAQAVALTTDPAVLTLALAQVRCLVGELRVLQKSIERFDQDIAAIFKAHPDAPLFRELPGAGPAFAPRLLVAFGSDRTRYPEASSLQKYSGVAPVRVKSANQEWTHWRWNAPRFLRQSFHEWAGQTVAWCGWAKQYYERKLAAGKNHHAILRALAFKWIRILWKCWVTRTPYDEATYLAALARRHPTPRP